MKFNDILAKLQYLSDNKDTIKDKVWLQNEVKRLNQEAINFMEPKIRNRRRR